MRYLGKITDNKDLVTKEYVDGAVKTYTGTSPISVSGTAISHANSGVTAASKGDTSNQTPAFGSTFKVTSGTVNATGHLTAFADHTVTIPSTAATQSAAGLMSAADKTKLDGIASGAQVNTVTGVKGNSESSYRTGNINLTAANIGAAASDHTHNYAGSASAGGPATSLSGFTNTTTSGTAVDSATQNGHVYVSGTSGIYNISDGACFVQAYSTSWVAQIYQDYRTGQIALRGKNSGTWQAWRKVLDSSNWSSFVTKSALGLGNVENKSSATIRSELTSANVTTALGYTPPQQDTNTHRPIQMNGSQILGDNTTALNLKAGSNVTLSNSSGTVTFAATDTTYESKTDESGGTAVSLCTTGEKYTWNNKQNALSAMTASEASTGTATTARSITAKVLSDLINDRITAAITNAIGGSY